MHGPSVWSRDSLSKDTSWIIKLSDAQLEAMDNAINNLDGDFDSIETIRREKQRLAPLSPLLDHTRNELNRGRGVVLYKGIDTTRYSRNQLRLLMWILGIEIGEPMVQNARGDLLGEVMDRGYDYDSNNVRGYTTKRALGFHCDASEVVALLCVHPARSGGASRIVCAAAIHNEIVKHHPEFLPSLYRGFHFDLRGEGANREHNEVTRHRVPVFHFYHGRLSVRFNYKTIIDGMRKAGAPVSGIDLAALDYVRELTSRPDLVVEMDFEAGDIQWLSNHDVLHARDEFIDFDEPERRRRLLRLWLTLPDGRPLRDEFSDRFNNGPKRGPKVVPGADYWAGA